MLKKTIKYEDYNGTDREEDFYFNLTKSEIIKLQMSYEGGFGEYLQSVAQSGNGKLIMELFRTIIKASYGVKSDDGRRFIKDDGVFEEFEQTLAYDELFTELCTDGKKGEEFINAVLPSSLVDIAQEEVLKGRHAS